MESNLSNLNYNIVSFLDGLGFIQGLTLGLLLILLSSKRQKSTFFLGLFLIFFSIKLLYYIESGLDLGTVYPELLLVPFNFSWLLFALFFVYCQKTSFFAERKTKYWVVIPGFISIGVQVVIFFLPYQAKLVIAQNFWHELLFTYLGIFYSWCIGVWNLVYLNRHSKAVNNYFSMVDFKELKWARIFLIYSLVSSVVIHILYFISPVNFYFRLLFSALDLLSIYWLSFFGVQQYNVYHLVNQEMLREIFDQSMSDRDLNLSTNISRTNEKLMERINRHMKNSEVFTNTELTIADLGEKLGVHPRQISNAINTIENQNFNSYVNRFRIKRAQLLLKDQGNTSFNIEDICRNVGFNSKSAFYSAFKKETGLSPSKFQQNPK